MKLMDLARIVCAGICLALGSVALNGSPQETPLSVEAVDAKVTVTDGVATASFAIKVTNRGAAAASSVSVVFGDGTTAAVADLAPEQSRTTGVQEKAFTYPEGSSRNFPVPVTLLFTYEGVAAEAETRLYLHVQ